MALVVRQGQEQREPLLVLWSYPAGFEPVRTVCQQWDLPFNPTDSLCSFERTSLIASREAIELSHNDLLPQYSRAVNVPNDKTMPFTAWQGNGSEGQLLTLGSYRKDSTEYQRLSMSRSSS